jgi:hypothetical protein
MIQIKSNQKLLAFIGLFLVFALVLTGLFELKKGILFGGGNSREKGNGIVFTKDVSFVRFIDNEPHLISDGKDVGGLANRYFEFSNGRLVFERDVDGENHVFFNGKDVGVGFRPMISADNLAFYRKIGDDTHLIYNDIDLGVVFAAEGHYSARIAGSNIAYEKLIDGVVHVIYNDKDLGDGHSFVLSEDGNDIAFERDSDKGSVVIYKGNIFAPGGLIYAVSNDSVWYASAAASSIFSSTHANGIIGLSGISKNSERIGEGIGFSCLEKKCAYQAIVEGKLHFIYDGKDFGEIWNTGNAFGIAKNNFFFMRLNEAGEIIVVHNGKELGVGSDPVIGGEGFAYVKMVSGKKHVIYNEKDLGEGAKPIISADGKSIAFVREVDGKKHAFVGTDDLGEIGGDELILKFSN